MNDQEFSELTNAPRSLSNILLAALLAALLFFSLGTCVGLKCAMDAPIVTKSDTTHVVVAGTTAPHTPVPTSVTYDDTASVTGCYPLSTAPRSSAAPKSTGYAPAQLPVMGSVEPAFLVPPATDSGRPADLVLDSLAIFRAVLRDYRARVTYGDTLRFDTAGITGWVVPFDTLRYNRIQARSWAYHFTLPVVTNTVKARERGALYFGGLTQFDSRINAGGPAASWKLPGGKVLLDGAILFGPGQLPQKQAGLKVRIGGHHE